MANCINWHFYVFIIAGLCGPVIFVMYDIGAEMMMEVMVGIYFFRSKFLVHVHSSKDLLMMTLIKETKEESIK